VLTLLMWCYMTSAPCDMLTQLKKAKKLWTDKYWGSKNM